MTIHEAADTGDVETIRKLLAEKTAVDARDERGLTPLMRAARRGRMDAFHTLRAAGAEVHARDARGYTALHWAAQGDQPDMIGVLLEAGIDIDEQALIGNTPLIAAALDGALEAVKVLVARGAAVNATSWQGQTAFQYATGRLGKEVRKVLGAAAKGAPKAKAPSQDVVFWRAAEEGDTAKVKQLLEAGVAVDTSFCYGESPLSRAIAFGHVETAHTLLAAGADARIRDVEGNTLLHGAALCGDVGLVQALLQKGLDVNAANRDGFTPLMAAAHEGHVDVVRLLLQAGADRSARGSFVDDKEQTALEFANKVFDRGVRKALKALLTEAGAAPDAIEQAFEQVDKFAANAKQPAFQDVVTMLGEACAEAPKPWKKCKGVLRCESINPSRLTARYAKDARLKKRLATLDAEGRAALLLERLQEEVQAAGFQLVRADATEEPATASLLLVPTADKYAVLAALGTDGANYGHDTRAIIRWLQAMEKDNPFALSACGHDFLAGRFTKPLTKVAELAERMCAFCPDLIDGDMIDSPAQVAEQLNESGEFFFWWD